MEAKEIIPFIEPLYRFCHHRLDNWHDAEDLAGEILLYALDGMGKYDIGSLEAWVWRIAHNRYARFLDARGRRESLLSGQELSDTGEVYWQVDEESVEEEYEPVFRYLHTLSSGYRDIFVDYYIGELSVRQLAGKYGLSEATVKWRLNVGRSRIRERIETNQMDKVYARINWNTYGCNGSMDTNRYLHSQVARAICLVAYEKPLTVEEISLRTGIPTLYIEDALPELEYGDAIRREGNKYATDFIIFRLKDRAATEAVAGDLVQRMADFYGGLLWEGETDPDAAETQNRSAGQGTSQDMGETQQTAQAPAYWELGFYGRERGMDSLGYILVPFLLRKKIEDLKNYKLQLASGNFPPRKDGGNGWFIVPEVPAQGETGTAAYCNGCNAHEAGGGHLYQYYHEKGRANGSLQRLVRCRILPECREGVVPRGRIPEEDLVYLVQDNLLCREGDVYKLNFPCFTWEQFTGFCALYGREDARMDARLGDWILSVRKSFEGFVPRRLHGQINQWLSVYCGELIAHVMEELIHRGRLKASGSAKDQKPATDGVFYIEGTFHCI